MSEMSEISNESDTPITGPITVFVCGSALSGQPDHGSVQSAKFLGEARTTPDYRMHSVKDGWHPGIYSVDSGGISMPGELYELTPDQYAYFLKSEPPHMYPVTVTLENGGEAIAMFYPEPLIQQEGWPDISDCGGWAAYKAQQSQSQS